MSAGNGWARPRRPMAAPPDAGLNPDAGLDVIGSADGKIDSPVPMDDTADLPVVAAGPTGPHRSADLPVLDVRGVVKTYGEGETVVHALRGVTLTVARGEYVAIMGASGSGKSTLMNLLGCLDTPTSGEYFIDGVDVSRLTDRQLALVRNRRIGFVFQSFNLIPRTTALANVELPLAYAGFKPAQRRLRAKAALALVGLVDRGHHEPNQLSGGQQQRVAVARALVTSPALLLADEPTGNLDTQSTSDVLGVLDQLNRSGRTIVLITHEPDVAAHASRLIRLVDGTIVEDTAMPARAGRERVRA